MRKTKLRSHTGADLSKVDRATLGPFAQRLHDAFTEIAGGQVTVREVEVYPPSKYGSAEVRRTRSRLGVSVAVFARMLGVSAKLVEHWEQGRRAPSALAARLLERVDADPDRFAADLLKERKTAG